MRFLLAVLLSCLLLAVAPGAVLGQAPGGDPDTSPIDSGEDDAPAEPTPAAEVERVSGPDRVATAVAASRRGFDRADTVVLAAAGTFPDALAATPLAAALGGPLLLVGPRVTPALAEELTRLGASEAVIIGAVAAVPVIVDAELARAGLDVRRIAGESRFDTAALIAREIGAPDGRAVVVSGSAFADALSIAPYAAAQGLPILLTPSDALVDDTADALTDLGVTMTLVVGGTAAVSDEVLAVLPEATRLSGPTRYDTSLAIAEFWAEDGLDLSTVFVVTGRDFPDALAAGPLAALARGPLLLVDGQDPAVPAATYEWLGARVDQVGGVLAFGGTSAMNEAVLDRLRDVLGVGGGA